MPLNQNDFSTQVVRDRGTGRWYQFQTGPLPWGNNPHVELRVLTDITERRNAELLREKHLEIMHQAAQLTTLAEISSTLAHEINQPLMAIATYTDACRRLLAAPDCDRADITRALERCHAQAVRAAAILERLREFIRQRRHRPAACDAQAVVAEAVEIVRPLLDENGIVLTTATGATPCSLVADRILLVQVLVNLLRNAVDALRDQPAVQKRIVVSVDATPEGEIAFAVADHGPGIDPATAETIFTPFHTTKDDGLGLGLSICRSVAEAHGGRLAVEPTPQGGATFRLILPTHGGTP
jgi:C4-dicarboxylate-specific signal transduction histidine kinase